MVGTKCPLSARGYSRDGKKGTLQVNFGLVADSEGRPVAVDVFKGNVGDPKTVMPQVKRVTQQFGINQFVMVGDRGMITQKHIDALVEEIGTGVAVMALGLGILTLPPETPLVGGWRDWIGLCLLIGGLLFSTVSIAMYSWERAQSKREK